MVEKKEYSSKERVKTSFSHKEPDRVPIGELAISERLASQIIGREAWVLCGGYFSGKIVNRMLMEGRRDELVQRHCEDTAELINKLGLDMLFINGYWPQKPRIPVSVGEDTWVMEDRANDMWFKYVYSPVSDTYCNVDCSIHERGFAELEKYIKVLERKLEEGPIASGEMDACRYFTDALGKDKFIIGNIQEGFPSDQSWFPVYLEGLILEPELIERYMRVKTKLAIASIDAQAEIGVDAVYGGKDFAGSDGLLLSPRLFRQFILPYLQDITKACHDRGIYFIKHEDGNVMQVIKDFLEDSGIDGYHAIEPGAGMDIGLLKKDFGDRITFIGNIDCAGVLVNGTEEDVGQAVFECIKKASYGGGHVICSSNAIHWGVPLKNYLAMLEAAKKYGKYQE